MQRSRSPVGVVSIVVLVAAGFASVGGARSATAQEPSGPQAALVEYYERLAAVPPRDAGAFVELAAWCSAQGLGDAASRSYEMALAVDGDNVAARTALGFERYGTSWRKRGAPPPERRVVSVRSSTDEEATTTAGASTAGASTADSSATIARTPAETSAPDAQPSSAAPAAEEARTSATEIERDTLAPLDRTTIAAAIERKKKWAEEAAAKLSVTFATHEDDDFLIHTTTSKSSNELKVLRANLATAKKMVAALLGARASTPIWPSKLQVVLLKSEPEYERFGEHVDEQRSVKTPEGGYSVDSRLVLWRPDSILVPQVAGSTALDEYNMSNAWVADWLRDGLSEFIVAQSSQGRAEGIYEENYVEAEELLKAEGDAFKVYNLLETQGRRARRAGRDRALAMTLVEFLLRKSRRGFEQLVETLKSDEAPRPPSDDGNFDTYFIEYVAHQDAALREAFRMSGDELDERWKEYVTKTAEKAAKTQAEKEAREEAERDREDRRRRGGR